MQRNNTAHLEEDSFTFPLPEGSTVNNNPNVTPQSLLSSFFYKQQQQ